MNDDFLLIANPDYDHKKPLGENGNWPDIVDPLCSAARWWCENFRLPILAEDYLAGDQRAFWEALRLIAEHQVAPPAWLAKVMLREFAAKTAPRKNGITINQAREVSEQVEKLKTDARESGRTISLDEISEQLSRPVSPATLDRVLKLYREYEERVKFHADNLP